jgi:argininosuccinate lyase
MVELERPRSWMTEHTPEQSTPSQNPIPDKRTPAAEPSQTLWHGRYQAGAAQTLRKLNDSLPFDKRMFAEDIEGSIAWARAIARAGVISNGEATSITDGLSRIRTEFDTGAFTFAAGDEDIHTAVERRLTELIGPVAGKLHTGRSRNDQVATDLRLWLFHNLEPVADLLGDLTVALLEHARAHAATVMPGYTHLRAAQPITFGHWLLSYVEMLTRDAVKIRRVAEDAMFDCPLGAGALAGVPFPVDRHALAQSLGFLVASNNSLDSVSNRDFVADCLYATALLTVHLSRFAEDLILYSTPQFDYIQFDEQYTTGSSLMPQKQNPDILELTRGKAGRLIGHASGFLATYKGTPSTYNKDLQEDKEPLFDAVETLTALLPALIGLVQTLRINPAKMRAGLDEGMLATDLADYLVRKGMPFREAHGVVGRVVRAGLDAETPLSKLPIDVYRAISDKFDGDLYQCFDFDASVGRRNQVGGTAPEQVLQQIARLSL